jgi:hypothetical protein
MIRLGMEWRMAGFFRFLWRLNAVLAFVALVAAIVFLTLFSKERISQPLLNYFIPPATQTVKPLLTYTYVLEPNLVLGGSSESNPFTLYRLMRWGKIKHHSGEPDMAAAVNILVVDKKTKTTAWLFKGVNRIIVSQSPLLLGRWAFDDYEADEIAPIHQVVMRIVEQDTNKDGYLGVDDRQTLYICRFDGKEPEKILSADQIWTADQDGKTYTISYRDGEKATIATYSVPDFKLIEQTKIDGMPK